MKSRFEAFISKYKVDEQTHCWNWTAAYDRQGYGRLKSKCAHRVSYELFIDTIPKGMWVLHKCDNVKCVNPDHLFLGTHQDNVNDKMSKGRYNIGRGAKKLTDAQVRWARNDYNTSDRPVQHYADMFGLSNSTMNYIIRGVSYSNV